MTSYDDFQTGTCPNMSKEIQFLDNQSYHSPNVQKVNYHFLYFVLRKRKGTCPPERRWHPMKLFNEITVSTDKFCLVCCDRDILAPLLTWQLTPRIQISWGIPCRAYI